MSLDSTSTLLSTAAVLVGLMGVVFGWLRWARPRLRRALHRIGAGLDTLAGRPPIVDNITGRELAPALPPLGERLDTMERTVLMLAQQDKDIKQIKDTLDNHGDRLKQLEDGTIERIATKAESAQAWRAMAAVAHQADPMITDATVVEDDAPELD